MMTMIYNTNKVSTVQSTKGLTVKLNGVKHNFWTRMETFEVSVTGRKHAIIK